MNKALAQEIIELDDRTCRGCGAIGPIGPPHHIVYRSQGGSDDPKNLITFCMDCDSKAHLGDGKGEKRKTARQFVIWVLEKIIDAPDFRWDDSLEVLRSREAA